MMRFVQRGSTDQSAWVQLLNADGDYVTGLTYSDVTITVRRFLGGRLVSELSLTPTELSAIDDPHADGGFVEDSSRKRYRVDLQDAAVATGLDSADKVELKVEATGVVGNTSEELMLVDELPWETVDGPHELNITVSDGSPVANANCVLKSGSQVKARGTTDANGNPAPTLYATDGTYTLITYSDGHITQSQSVEVDGGDVTVEVTLTANTPAASADPDTVTGYSDALDVDLAVAGSVTHSRQLIKQPAGSGLTFDDSVAEFSSDSGGRVDWGELACGATYRFIRGDSNQAVDVVIPSPGDDNYADPFPVPNFRG